MQSSDAGGTSHIIKHTITGRLTFEIVHNMFLNRLALEVIGVIGYKLKAKRGIGYETTKGFPAKSGLTRQSRVYSSGCSHAGYGRGG